MNLRVRRRMAEGRRTRSKDHSPEEKSGGALKIAVTGQLQNVVKVLKVALALLSTASASPSPTKARTPPLQRELSPPFTSPAIPFVQSGPQIECVHKLVPPPSESSPPKAKSFFPVSP